MAKQLGRAMLLRYADAGAATAASPVIATIRSKSIVINNSPIDVTTPDSVAPGGALWMETLSGLKSVGVSGDGIFSDSQQEVQALAAALGANPVKGFAVQIPEFGTYAGMFRIESFELGGEMEGAITFSISLTSTGPVAFTAA